VVRLSFIIGFLALTGLLLSGLAAYRVHDQELTVDGIALARAVDVPRQPGSGPAHRA
jgi:hypothetical protein